MSTNQYTPGLTRIVEYFKKTGPERLNGLDSSYFKDLTPDEKREAWIFLEKNFNESEDQIIGLYLLDPQRAVAAFKIELEKKSEQSPYAATRSAIEACRVTMLQFVCADSPNSEALKQLASYCGSAFPNVRAKAAQALPFTPTSNEAVSALEGVLFTETDRLALASATEKFLAIFGFKLDIADPTYKSLYLKLRGQDLTDKKRAIEYVKQSGSPVLLTANPNPLA